MGTISDKLEYLNDTKQLLKQKINNLGGDITDNTTFRQYADKLQTIYNNAPKTDYAEGSNITLSNCLKGKLDYEDNKVGYGDTEQKTNLYNNDIEQGSIAEGVNTNANNRIRTAGYIEVIPSSTIPISFTGCDDWFVSFYDSSKTYKSSYGWQASGNSVPVPSNISYIRIVFRKNDNSNITPSSISNIQIGNLPSPSYPSEVKTVTGEQEVVVRGKNWFGLEKRVYTPQATQDVTASINNGKLTASGTSNAHTSYSISVVIGEKYTIIWKNATGLNSVQVKDGQDGEQYFRNYNTTGLEVITTHTDTLFLNILSSGTTLTIEDVMVVKGEYTSSTIGNYEPYITPITKTLNLGKNLFNAPTNFYVSDYYICPCSIGDVFTFSFKGLATANNRRIFLRTYYGTFTDNLDSYVDQTVLYLTTSDDNYNTTITCTTNGFIYFRFADGSGNYTIRDIMLERGSTATSYAPYFTPIEFAEIGTYRDYIWTDRSTGKWYKHSAIQKITLNGQETGWQYDSTYLYFKNSSYSLDDIVPAGGTVTQLCNRFIYESTWATFRDSTTSNMFFKIQNSGYKICIRNTSYNDTDNFKTWLSNNNVNFYYPLATATDTEITDTTLINQLEDIYNSMSINGTTVIEISGDLPMIMKVRTLKGE